MEKIKRILFLPLLFFITSLDAKEICTLTSEVEPDVTITLKYTGSAEPVYFKVIVTSGSTSLVRVQISFASREVIKNSRGRKRILFIFSIRFQ